jgi:hypothetical protein
VSNFEHFSSAHCSKLSHRRLCNGIHPVTESVVLPPDVRDYILLDHSRVANESHPCPQCQGRLVLTEIKPSRIGFEVRTFQGVNCNHVYKLESATESMKCLPGLELYKSQKG